MTRIERFGDLTVGAEPPVLELEVDRLALIKYAGAADDYVRQHWDHPFMIDQGYPDVIGHGWLTFAHMCRGVTDWAPPTVARITEYAVRYHKPLHPGLLSCGGAVVSAEDGLAKLTLWAKSAAGDMVATGNLTLAPA